MKEVEKEDEEKIKEGLENVGESAEKLHETTEKGIDRLMDKAMEPINLSEVATLLNVMYGERQPTPKLTLSAEGREGVEALMSIFRAPTDLAVGMVGQTIKPIPEEVEK